MDKGYGIFTEYCKHYGWAKARRSKADREASEAVKWEEVAVNRQIEALSNHRNKLITRSQVTEFLRVKIEDIIKQVTSPTTATGMGRLMQLHDTEPFNMLLREAVIELEKDCHERLPTGYARFMAGTFSEEMESLNKRRAH